MTIESVAFIGKESNKLEEVEEGSVADAGDVFTEYADPRRDEWTASIWPWLKSRTVPEVMELTGYPRKTIQRWRQGQRPSTKSLARLSAMLRRGDSK